MEGGLDIDVLRFSNLFMTGTALNTNEIWQRFMRDSGIEEDCNHIY